ncbi:hypothetical protein [Arthrobacter sp. D3-16]
MAISTFLVEADVEHRAVRMTIDPDGGRSSLRMVAAIIALPLTSRTAAGAT